MHFSDKHFAEVGTKYVQEAHGLWWSAGSTATAAFCMMTYKPSKLGLTSFLVCEQTHTSVGVCIQDYKSLCVVVMICTILVNTQTHTNIENFLPDILPAELTSRPAIAGNPRCKNITAKSVHLTSLYHMALTSTNDHLSVLRHYVCT